MNLVAVQNLSKHFGEHTLFSDVSFQINEGEKIGLVGANGCGKTTLFRILTKELAFDDGTVSYAKIANIGYMEQHVAADDTRSAYEAVLDVFDDLKAIEAELEQIVSTLQAMQQASEAELAPFIKRQHTLQEQFERREGYTYQSRARAALLGLGFNEAMMQQSVQTLSGGEKAKVALARLLLSQSNLLLLDEPTNHLDMTSVAWLEDFLRNYSGAALIISHDRYFLDRVVSQILEMEHGHVSPYLGNYSTYREKKHKMRETAQKHYDNTMKEIKRLEGIVAQQRQWNRERNIRTAESKLKQIDRLKKTLVKPENELDSMKLRFHDMAPAAQDVLQATDIKKSYDNRLLFEHIDMTLAAGDHVFLLGANGCGKTTLMKILVGEIPPDDGAIRLGSGIMPGYYDQTHSTLATHKTILQEMSDSLPQMSQGQLRNALGAFLFRGDDVFKLIETLSGGERARIALLKLMLSQANFLLLDEPTNHLDIASREILEDALSSYGGTLLIVSHDRYFINKLAHRILALKEGALEESLGNYDDYLMHIQRQNQTSAAEEKQPPSTQKSSPNKLDYHQTKEQQRKMRALEGKIKRLETAIAETEGKIDELETQLCQPDIATDYQKAAELGQKTEELRQQNERRLDEWMALDEELQAIRDGDER